MASLTGLGGKERACIEHFSSTVLDVLFYHSPVRSTLRFPVHRQGNKDLQALREHNNFRLKTHKVNKTTSHNR